MIRDEMIRAISGQETKVIVDLLVYLGLEPKIDTIIHNNTSTGEQLPIKYYEGLIKKESK